MATSSPFTDDPDQAEVWELGYVAGFQDPDGTDTFRPLSPDLLDIFTQGIDAGRDDRIAFPPASQGTQWVQKSELDSDSSDEMGEHLIIEGVAEFAAHFFKTVTLGLIGVVITALSIQGDTPLQPLDDDFSEPYTGPEADTNVFFIATCPRPDHPIPAIGTTPDGYWVGTPENDFVARCSLTDNTCGAVWVAG
jgi:hypothetical protein